jgi:hypothetical protein
MTVLPAEVVAGNVTLTELPDVALAKPCCTNAGVADVLGGTAGADGVGVDVDVGVGVDVDVDVCVGVGVFVPGGGDVVEPADFRATICIAQSLEL